MLKELGDFAAIYELLVYTDKANMSIQIKLIIINVYKLFKKAKIDLTTPRVVDAYRNNDSTNTGGVSLQDEN